MLLNLEQLNSIPKHNGILVYYLIDVSLVLCYQGLYGRATRREDFNMAPAASVERKEEEEGEEKRR